MKASLIPEPPGPEGHLGQWAAFLYQRCPGTWADVAQSFGATPATVYSAARTYCKLRGYQHPVLKCEEGDRRIVR